MGPPESFSDNRYSALWYELPNISAHTLNLFKNLVKCTMSHVFKCIDGFHFSITDDSSSKVACNLIIFSTTSN